MKKHLFLLFIFFSQFCIGQNNTYSFLVKDSLGRKQGYWIITGKMQKDTSYAPNAKVSEGNYVDGKKDGVWVSYFPNGYSKSSITYVKGVADGYKVVYYDNGGVKERGTWKNQHWVGAYAAYYSGTRLISDSVYWSQSGKELKRIKYEPTGIVIHYDAAGHRIPTKISIDSSRTVTDSALRAYNDATSASMRFNDPQKIIPRPYDGEGYWKIINDCKMVEYEGWFRGGELVNGKRYIDDGNCNVIIVYEYKDGKCISVVNYPLK